MFKRNTFLALLVAGGLISAATASPLDLEYRITGFESLRPSLVFNDNNDTYIQGDESLRVIGVPYEREGPYLVVRGIPERLVLEGKGMRRVSIIYVGSTVTPKMLAQQGGTQHTSCDQTEIESKRIELIYGSANARPGPVLSKTLKSAMPSIKNAAFTKVYISMDEGGMALSRVNALRDLFLKNNVPQSKFAIEITDDPTGQHYMLIGNAAPCVPVTSLPSTPTAYPTPLTGSAVQGKTIYAPAGNQKPFAAGDIDTILQLLSEGRISEETASTMIAGVNLSKRGTKLERLYAQSKMDDTTAPVTSKPQTVSPQTTKVEVVLQHKPGVDLFVPAPIPAEAPKQIAGQFTVENKEERSHVKGEVFEVAEFSKKPSPKTMARLARVVGDKNESLFVVKGDGSPESKSAASIAAKSLMRLGVESVRFDRGANKGDIEIVEEKGARG